MYQKVLIVEDTTDVRIVCQEVLEREGYHVRGAEDGLEALVALREEPWDLVLLDHRMPRMSGLELLDVMRSTRQWSEIPVILMTGLSDPATKARAASCGHIVLMEKPISILRLVQVVRNLLSEQLSSPCAVAK